MRLKIHTTLSALALSLLLGGTGAALAQDYAAGPIRISHPWAPPTSDSAKDAPGYLTLTNTGSVPDRLISGSFIEASHLQIHTTTTERGRTKMTSTDALVINPGETIVLKPGGPHLMFVDLKGPLKAGMSAQSILRFERSGTVLLEFVVEGSASKAKSARKDGGKAIAKAAEKPAEKTAHAHDQ